MPTLLAESIALRFELRNYRTAAASDFEPGVEPLPFDPRPQCYDERYGIPRLVRSRLEGP